MNVNQYFWALKHDWFKDAQKKPDGEIEVTAVCSVVLNDGEVVSDTLITTDYQKLRNWAGY